MSKDAIKLFDDIVVLFKILTFISTLLLIFVIFLYIFCAQTVLDSDRSIKSSGILSPDETMSDLTPLPEHEELIVALVLIFVVVRYVIHFGLTQVSCLHASASWLIRIQSDSNPHPEVSYVIWIRMQVNAFTRIRVSLIRIPIQVKRCM